MGSTSAWSSTFAAALLGAFVLQGALVPGAARAQHSDAGVEKAAVPPESPAAEPPAAEPAAEPPAAEPAPAAPGETAPAHAPSGVLPKVLDPSQLSEGVRARLAERSAGKHPSRFPTREPDGTQPEGEPRGGAAPVPSFGPRIGTSEPARRGLGRSRVQAVETDEGVTLLSNRIQLPERRLSQAVAKLPAPEPEVVATEEPIAAEDSTRVTETHSLLPLSSRSSPSRKNSSTGLGWLLWPFVLFVTTGAVVGTLWFRKKTE